MKVKTAFGLTVLLSASMVLGQENGIGGFRPKRFRPEVPPILIRAIQAQPTLRYAGTYTVEFRQGPSSLRHEEYIIREGSSYRIEFPNDSQFAGQVIVEDQNERLHYHPNTNEIVQQPSRHGEAWEKVANLANNRKFKLEVTPGETIAGYKTDQIEVHDESGNLTQRLFIEPGSGLIMKRQIYDLVGTQAGFFEFTKVDLNPRIDSQAFVIRRKNARLITPTIQLQRICQKRGFALRILSPATGYRLESANRKMFAGVEGVVQTYLNGKIRLWVYQLKAPVDPDKLRQQAGKNLKFFSWQANGETIVMMGNVAEREMERFATMMTSGTSTPSAKL